MGFVRSKAESALFIKKTERGLVLALFYFDDIIVTGSDDHSIALLKHLKNKFEIKDLGNLKYFLGIEVARSRKGIVLNQRWRSFLEVAYSLTSGIHSFSAKVRSRSHCSCSSHR